MWEQTNNILPKKDCPPLLGFEKELMLGYNEITENNDLKTGVLNLGAAEHVAPPDIENSMRYKAHEKSGHGLSDDLEPISWEKLQLEMKKHIN